jgi:hypothetical protein
MRRSSTKTCAGLLAVVAIALLGPSTLAADEPAPSQTQEPTAASAPAQTVWSEKIGFEISGITFPIDSSIKNSDNTVVFGASLLLRGPTRRWDWFYWTTAELGGGMLFPKTSLTGGLNGFHAELGTEVGILIFDGEFFEARFGLGITGGFLLNWLGEDCQTCNGDSGGVGLIFAPVVSLRGKVSKGLTLGLTFRALVPTLPLKSDDHNYGANLLVALDIGIR